MYALGVMYALLALVGWGVGDFLIQKTTRRIGNIPALFFITGAGAVFLLPFAWRDLAGVLATPASVLLLLLAGLVTFFASLFNFEALKEGKLSIIEPVVGLELPIIIILGITLRNEHLTLPQGIACILVFIGILLAVTTHRLQLNYSRRWFERGVVYAGLGAIGMALTVFLVGVASQETSPIVTIWFTHTVVAVICLLYLAGTKQLKSLRQSFRRHPTLITGEALFDNIAWVSFGAAATHLPISIATTLSESYVVLAVLLGVVVSKEKLKRSQLLGVICALAGITILSLLVSG